MNVYADQNFLINRANRPELRIAAATAANTGKVDFVLAPWHFYEIGTTGPGRIKR